MEPYPHHRFLTFRNARRLAARARVQEGFTLIEMLMVLAIIVIITTIALSGQTLFNSSVVLTNTAYDVALSLRQTETFGIASRVFNGVANAGYGIEFSKATPASYVSYADVY